jgi:hypothetical protein
MSYFTDAAAASDNQSRPGLGLRSKGPLIAAMSGICAGVIALALASEAWAQTNLTYPALVRRLTNLEHLATLPQAGETTALFSSHDRASRYDEATGRYVDWDANQDLIGVVRKAGTNVVLAEMDGPGCIWRIWSASPKDGHVRIFLDGSPNPAVDLPFRDYFSGTNEPFTRPALVHVVAQGNNNYTPIPYQKSCRIVADEDWGQPYQFTCTTFPKGTVVPTFTRELSAEDNTALDEADRALTHCGPREFPDGSVSRGSDGLIVGGGGFVQAKLDGPAAINAIRVKFDPPLTNDDRAALRELVLEIRWDGEFAPSVWTPLGDFFGTGPGANPYRSLPCGITEGGEFYANWFMPFTNSAEITIRNEGPTNRRLKFEIHQAELKGDLTNYARFHAKWHRDEFLPTRLDRSIDWPLLKTTGRGRFVGVMLQVWNPRGQWWGEGDEKFFVDGEKFPSSFGTGSEDYFGYGWCDPTPFQHALHNQTRNDGKNKDHISVNRWQIADQVPFQKSFEGCIEKFFPNSRPTLYAATAYWYLESGGDDPYQPASLRERTGNLSEPTPKQVAGAIEGERLKILGKTAGRTRTDDASRNDNDRWSDDSMLLWIVPQSSERLDLAIPVPSDGLFDLRIQLTKGQGFGIVQLSLDDKTLGDPIDLYDKMTVTTGELELGTHELTAGEHKVSIEMKGANPKARGDHMFGLDYIKLDQIK